MYSSLQAHCMQSTMVQNKRGREKSTQKSVCSDSSVGSRFAQHKLLHQPKLAAFLRGLSLSFNSWEMWKFWPGDKRRQSIRITAIHVSKQNCLSLSNVFLIPCASLSMVSHTINFLFKVLFIFSLRYLFAINLVPIFRFRRVYLSFWTAFPSNLTHRKRYVAGA